VVPVSGAGIIPMIFKLLPMDHAKLLKALRKANASAARFLPDARSRPKLQHEPRLPENFLTASVKIPFMIKYINGQTYQRFTNVAIRNYSTSPMKPATGIHYEYI
jgi:hypothetical protein